MSVEPCTICHAICLFVLILHIARGAPDMAGTANEGGCLWLLGQIAVGLPRAFPMTFVGKCVEELECKMRLKGNGYILTNPDTSEHLIQGTLLTCLFTDISQSFFQFRQVGHLVGARGSCNLRTWALANEFARVLFLQSTNPKANARAALWASISLAETSFLQTSQKDLVGTLTHE